MKKGNKEYANFYLVLRQSREEESQIEMRKCDVEMITDLKDPDDKGGGDSAR